MHKLARRGTQRYQKHRQAALRDMSSQVSKPHSHGANARIQRKPHAEIR